MSAADLERVRSVADRLGATVSDIVRAALLQYLHTEDEGEGEEEVQELVAALRARGLRIARR